MKKIGCLLLTAAVAMSLAGCNNSIITIEGADNSESPEAVKEEESNIVFNLPDSVSIDGEDVAVESYKGTEDELINAIWLKEDSSSHSACDFFSADETDYSQYIMFAAAEEISDFKFLSLDDFDWSDELSLPVYSIKELDTRTVSPKKPLIVRMTFFGDMPSYGISYTGKDNKTCYYALNMSGYDGSLCLDEFAVTE